MKTERTGAGAGTGTEGAGAASEPSGATQASGASQAAQAALNAPQAAQTQAALNAPQAAQTQAAQYDYGKFYAMMEAGESIPEEFQEQYESDYLSGKKPERQQAQPQPEAPQEQEQASAEGGQEQARAKEIEALMNEVGAKTPQEAAAKARELRNAFTQASERAKRAEEGVERQEQLIRDLAAGDPEAYKFVKDTIGLDFPARPAAQQPAQAPPEANPFLLSDEEIGNSLDPDLGRLFNGKLQALRSHFEQALAKHGESAQRHEAALNEQRKSARVAELESRVTDDVVSLAEANPDIYGLAGKPVRELVERWRRDPAHPPPELSELVSTVCLYADLAEAVHDGKLTMSLADIHRIRHFDKLNGKIAQAKIEAAKGAATSAKPTAGVHGATQTGSSAAASVSDETAAKMAAGELDMPDEWFEEDGVPAPTMPANLRSLMLNIA